MKELQIRIKELEDDMSDIMVLHDSYTRHNRSATHEERVRQLELLNSYFNKYTRICELKGLETTIFINQTT